MNNSTIDAHIVQCTWNNTAIFGLFVFISGLLTNGTVVLALLSRHAIWSPFMVYVFNLFCANILQSFTGALLDFINSYCSVWFLGRTLCFVYNYGEWTAAILQMLCHPLIALNRITAIYAPVFYRHTHTYRNAILLCVLTWLLAHIITLPMLIINTAVDVRDVCHVDLNEPVQKWWAFVLDVVCVLCIGMVAVCFPVVYVKYRRSRLHSMRVRPIKPDNASDQSNRLDIGVIGDALSRSQMFLLLLLTISTLILWTPGNLYALLSAINLWADPAAEAIIIPLFAMQAILDPIIFILSLPPLRMTVRNFFRCNDSAHSQLKI
ncbi:C-C chemokine receptor type 8-like [Paramacrobiotus metropolitanus]|uniref:C-C chemokine receptor type 8-like n=1 Tax=Paramacrobiotus metropolitanus TaxID=2943436 RepID=UPI002445D2C1|nr:C-C chemokine receptor type 8-like [Paramacrobiotus metropolitanus]